MNVGDRNYFARLQKAVDQAQTKLDETIQERDIAIAAALEDKLAGATDIAAATGLSRGRIYQIATRHT